MDNQKDHNPWLIIQETGKIRKSAIFCILSMKKLVLGDLQRPYNLRCRYTKYQAMHPWNNQNYKNLPCSAHWFWKKFYFKCCAMLPKISMPKMKTIAQVVWAVEVKIYISSASELAVKNLPCSAYWEWKKIYCQMLHSVNTNLHAKNEDNRSSCLGSRG